MKRFTLILAAATAALAVGSAAEGDTASARSRPVLEGRFAAKIKVVRAENLDAGRRVGRRLARTIRVRRSCRSTGCRSRVAVENKYGTFAYTPLSRRGNMWTSRFQYKRKCSADGIMAVHTATIRLHPTATATRSGRTYASRVEGTFRSVTPGTGACPPGKESWVFQARRTDLPD